ncbi:MAG: SLBB domain-containing protein [Nitrospirae bacterium]|nr:SLBB domain-containing protein [Nitrospirota bacterium]
MILKALVIAILSIAAMSLPAASLAQESGLSAPSAPGPSTPTPSVPSLESLSPQQIQKGKEMLQPPVAQTKAAETPATGGSLPAPPKQTLSAFEAYIQGKLSQTISTDIKQFGYDLFERPPTTFAPVEIVPVGPGYLLGPGDEIRITVWGKVNAEYPTVIDREGKISLPQIGILHLSGLTFSEAKTFLEKEFSRYYQPSEVKMNVSMGRLRSIQVFVVGNVRNPGSYTLSSLSTLINALFAAGGPSKIGTLRDIQVKRNGETIIHFDLYDFLLKGDKTQDIRLMPEDVIFIPPVGLLVGIAGNIKNPAIYELKGEARLLDLIDMAGGLTASAFKGRVQVHRIEEHQFRAIFEGDLIDVEKDSKKSFVLKDGDFVKVFSVVETKNTVIIAGAVADPGEYGIAPETTKVADVILRAGGLVYYASNLAELTRIKVTQTGPETERFVIDLSKAMMGDPAHNIPLEINDYLLVKTIPEWELYRTVSIKGEVKFPGIYTTKKGETLSSLIERAGGLTDKAYLKGVIFTRESVKELQQRQLDEAIDRLEQQILSQSAGKIEAALSSEDVVLQKAAIEQRRALITKMRAAKAKGRISIRLDVPEKLRSSPSDLVLEEGDALVIPEKPQQVQVLGSVYNQTAFIFDRKATVSGYLKKAGGATRDADEAQLYVLKIDGTAVSEREDSGFLGFGGVRSSYLDPGDTIVVPEKIERVAWLKDIKDITQILFQIAATAAIVIKVF